MTGVAPPSSPAWHRHHHRRGTVVITGVAPRPSPAWHRYHHHAWHRHHHRRHALTIAVVTFTVFTPSPIQIYQMLEVICEIYAQTPDLFIDV
ncbi:hypothetical protein Tco_0372974, partial [Tanacetum coccineum]